MSSTNHTERYPYRPAGFHAAKFWKASVNKSRAPKGRRFKRYVRTKNRKRVSLKRKLVLPHRNIGEVTLRRSIDGRLWVKAKCDRWYDGRGRGMAASIRRRNGVFASRVFQRVSWGRTKVAAREEGEKSRSKFRAICSMALPGCPFPRGTVTAPEPCRSHGEIQIYAPTAPGVFFELMKNESSRGSRLLSKPLVIPPTLGGLPPSASTPFSYALSF